MQTGVLDKNGTMICTGDIVHFRCSGLSAHGRVVEHEEFGFAIEDDRPRTKGRLYSMKNEGVYRIESHSK